MYITAMVRVRPETALEIIKKEMELSYSWKEKTKQYSFVQGIENPFLFWERNKKILSQSTSNYIPIWNKST